MLPKLGVIAGKGDLPRELARLYIANGGECFIAAIHQEINLGGDLIYRKFALGSVGKIIDYFQEMAVENIVIVGGIDRPDLTSLRVDMAGSVLIAQILKQKVLGDDNVLRTVSKYIESKGFKVISPQEILSLSGYKINIVSKKTSSRQDNADIEIGKKVITSLGDVDIGQSVIVCDGYVLGIEAAEGTDNLIRRCELLRKKKNGGVLVKMSKFKQDMRLDVPVIGPETIFYLAKHGFNGVAIEKEGVIVINSEETKKLLDDNGLFIKSF